MSARIERIRNNKLLSMDGIDFGRVIATELYDTSFKGYEKHLAKCLLYNFEVTIKENGNKLKLFEYSLGYTHRKDYEEIRNLFLEYFDDYTYIDVDRKNSKKHIIAKLAIIIGRFFRYLFGAVKTPMLCAILVTEYKYLHKEYLKFSEFINQAEVLVTFCDARCEDNLLTQMVQKSKVTTATLQHGQYRVLDEKHEKADVESYKNFISDYLFAWGNATKKEFERYNIDSKRILTVGALKSLSFINKLEKHEDTGIFGVVMCADTYPESNISMIKLANEISHKYGIKYFLRFHPRNNVDMYMKYVEKKCLFCASSQVNNKDYASSVDFSIIHMTGVFVELLALNSIIFVLDDDYLEDLFKIYPYCINSIDSFDRVYDELKNKPEYIYQEQYKHYKDFNCAGNIRENYIRAMKSILGEK